MAPDIDAALGGGLESSFDSQLRSRVLLKLLEAARLLLP